MVALCFIVMGIGVIGLGADLAVSSWRFPGRVDDPLVLIGGRRAPSRYPWPIGPRPYVAPTWSRFVEIPRAGGPGPKPDVIAWALVAEPCPVAAPANDGRGATADWSPLAEVGAVESDTWDEADILAGFDAIVSSLHAEPDWLKAFRSDSQHLAAYRAMALERTGEFTPREHMQLEALLKAW